MKIVNLFEEDISFNTVRRAAVMALDVEDDRELWDAIDHGSWRRSNKFIFSIEINIDFGQLDISSMFLGNRKHRRELQKRIQNKTLNEEKYFRFCHSLKNVINNWEEIGLRQMYTVRDNIPNPWQPSTFRPEFLRLTNNKLKLGLVFEFPA